MSHDDSTDEVAARLAALIEALPDAIFFKDGDGCWRLLNSAALRLFGLAGKAWEGKTDLELALLYPDLAEAYAACHRADEQAWTSGSRFDTTEYLHDPHSGELHTFEVTKLPLFHPDGSRRGLLAIGHDITPHIRIEEAERRQRASLRRLSEIATFSRQPLVEQFRQALTIGAVHLGLEFGIVSEIQGDSYRIVSQISPPDTLADNQTFSLGDTYCGGTVQQGGVVAIEHVGNSDDRGHPCYRTSHLDAYIAAPVIVDDKVFGTVNFSTARRYGRKFDDGDREFVQLLARWVGSAIERDRMGRRLADSEGQLRTIIETEPECVKLMAADGTLLQMNRAGLDMLGADSADEVIGKSVPHMILPEYRREFDELTRRVFYGDSGRLEFEIINLKGVHLWLETTAAPLRGANNDITALLSVTRDVTERKSAELALQASEQRFRSIMDSNPVGMAIVSLHGIFLRVNDALCNITGYSHDELEHLTFNDITHPDDVPRQRDDVLRLINGEIATYQLEKRYQHKDGHLVWVQVNASLVHDQDGQPFYVIGQVEDISNKKRAELALQESEEKFRGMFELSPIGIALNDLSSGRYIEANPSLLISTGYTAQELYALRYQDLTSAEYGMQDQEQLARLRKSGRYGPYEKEYIRKDGTRYPVLLSGVRINDGPDRDMILSVVQDISERKAAEAEIHRLAFYDPLTRLANRRLLLDRIRQAFHAGARRETYGAVLFIDLDNFKLLNDTMGHDAGDQLLIEMAQRLLSCVRADDTVARLGGDEFVVMLKHLNHEVTHAAAHAKRVAEKIRTTLNDPVLFAGHQYQTTPSIGVSLFHGTDQTADELLKHADVALYCAKNAGRNRVCFFDPSMQEALDSRAELEADLWEALREGQFSLFYQLQVGCNDHVHCAEGLLRWSCPKRGLVGPNDFIPLAEETGLIVPIGYWVLETACKQLKAWEAGAVTRHIQISVNISSRQFHQPDFVEQVRSLVENTGIAPARLKLELTESIVFKDIEDTVEKMRALKAIGVGLSMDDFGTGFSSLSYLVQLPFEQLKIDQSFVHNMTATPANSIVVETIINLARNLGLDVIAEGVETEEQHALLTRHGCPSFQGFLFGHPVPAAEFEKMLSVRDEITVPK